MFWEILKDIAFNETDCNQLTWNNGIVEQWNNGLFKDIIHFYFIAETIVAINSTVQYPLRAIGFTHFSNIPLFQYSNRDTWEVQQWPGYP
jgi:hypothetical protein